jgi:hypothetical protein
MFECSCGKTYKYASGLTNHKEKCGGGSAAVAGGGGGGGAAVASSESQDPNDITKSPFFTIPLTSFQPTANFTKEDLEMLEKRKQARLKAILQSQKEQADKDKEKEKKIAADAVAAAVAAAASVASKVKSHVPTKNGGGGGGGGGGGAAAGGKVAGKGGGSTATATATSSSTVTNGAVVTNNKNNVGNEEHNASFNINYVRRSEETQQIVRAVTATAHQFCKGRIIVTSDEPAPPGAGINGVSTTVNADGTTVHNHPTRTISIIEAPPEEVSPEEEHDITLEKMTYLILSLIQNNNKLTKENNVLRQIVDQLDPTYFG